MKTGIRKPNIKKSISARTTGKVKRAVKKSVNPMYGKKGAGCVKDRLNLSKMPYIIELPSAFPVS